ncbi:hypothetical protein MXD95_005560 [Frankia sp. AiPa1]|nr:hypothetical protein [Frankia sp. AiPa1]
MTGDGTYDGGATVTNRLRLGRRASAVAVLLLWGAALAGPGSAALAASPAPSARASAGPTPDFALTVSPTRLVIPQEQLSKDQHFAVTNHGRLPLNIVVNRAGFTAGRNGTLQFQHEEAPYSAMTWLSASPVNFHLAPGARQVVAVRIAVPEHPEPGDHQVAILFMVPPGKDEKQIKLNRGIGVPLFITVPGPVDDTVKISSVRTSGFATGGPIDFTAVLRDTGTVHRDFRGKGHLNISVGGHDVAFPDFTVQRGSTRQVTARWDNPPLICVCHATVAVSGRGGTLATARATVVVFPLRQAVAVLVGVLAILLFGLFVRRGYRARVMAEARALRRREDLGDPTGSGRTGTSTHSSAASGIAGGDPPEDLLKPDGDPGNDTPDR